MARPSLREKLASSAVDTLHSMGFKGCSIQDITEAAGVPKGSFFNHFENKEDLAIDALQRYLEGSRADMLSEPGVAPLQRLRNHFEFLASRLAECGYERGCMMGIFAAEMAQDYPRMRAELRQVFESWGEGIESVLREAQTAGDIDPRHDPAMLARFVVNSWQGAAVRVRLAQNAGPLNDFFHVCFKVLLK
jgi:TetR/AcrR family transcriptional regulator, transcriptional repressor for nem operon